MLDVLEFIFSDGWHFIGVAILLTIIFDKPIVKISRKSKAD